MPGAKKRERATTVAHYLEALHRRDQSIIAWEQFFETWDVLLCPVSMVTAFSHCETGAPLPVGGQNTPYWMAEAYCRLFNYTGHPVMALLVTQDRQDLPIGVQVVGKRWRESRLLAIAEAISHLTAGFRRPPGD